MSEAFDPVAAGRDLLATGLVGSLATLNPDGGPYASLVALAPDSDGAPLTLISTLAVHTRNLAADPRASILIDRRAGEGPDDPLTRARISLVGRLARTAEPRARRRFLAHNPDAAMYADFADFAFWRLEIEAAHLVAGFGRIVDLKPGRLLTELSDAGPLLDAEAEAVDHMNEDHADALDLYAAAFAGASGTGFRCAACDPDGLTLVRGREVVRVPFPRRVTALGVLRQVLKQMADRARAGAA